MNAEKTAAAASVPEIDQQDRQEVAIRLSHRYFNGFSINLSNADVGLILAMNNQPISAVSMSFSTAKTLAKKLTAIIEDLERHAGREIMDIDFLAGVVDKLSKTPK